LTFYILIFLLFVLFLIYSIFFFALVALWRQAGTHAATAAEMHDPQGRTRGATDPQALAQSLAPDTAALAALRGWLRARLNWVPG